ncbi:MAG: hypothetical protein OXF57_00415 [Rhodospirillaceae bacterium]|nr:hypothetical protein [Rhodospirillaceae bacterium]
MADDFESAASAIMREWQELARRKQDPELAMETFWSRMLSDPLLRHRCTRAVPYLLAHGRAAPLDMGARWKHGPFCRPNFGD